MILPGIGKLPGVNIFSTDKFGMLLDVRWPVVRAEITSCFEMVTSFNNIFVGHTNTTYRNIDKPMKASNIYNLDTGGVKRGRLTIMNVEAKKFWQSDKING